jgi:peptide chain release factor 1
MYQRYASTQGWSAKMVSCVEADAGGFKEVVLQVRGGL